MKTIRIPHAPSTPLPELAEFLAPFHVHSEPRKIEATKVATVARKTEQKTSWEAEMEALTDLVKEQRHNLQLDELVPKALTEEVRCSALLCNGEAIELGLLRVRNAGPERG